MTLLIYISQNINKNFSQATAVLSQEQQHSTTEAQKQKPFNIHNYKTITFIKPFYFIFLIKL